jgi:BMFP domain-containing protein YqiC
MANRGMIYGLEIGATLDCRRLPVKPRARLRQGAGDPIVPAMTQTTGRLFDELGKLLTDAAGAAEGVRKEVEGAVRSQAERVLRDLDVVQREEFEAVKAMAQKAREENDTLKARIAALEARLAAKGP